MRHNLYTVHDRAAGAFLPPFAMHADGMAERVFADCCNDKKHQFGKHPEDYTLFRIGAFDDLLGSVTTESAPVSLGNGLIFLVVDFVAVDRDSEGEDNG